MRIYFVGIGGAGIGPLALIAHEAGYDVVGSDAKDSSYVKYLRGKGIEIFLDQSGEAIKEVDLENKIDWVVGVSSIIRDNPNHPELAYARDQGIAIHERDALLNKIISDNNLNLIAVAGTHGKTTTTAMIIWLMQQLGIKASYSVGAKLPFADMSMLDKDSSYFIYECDEYHKNFLHFYPEVAVISGIAWDHHEVFKTENEYNEAFVQFLNQSDSIVIYEEDATKINWSQNDNTSVLAKRDANQLSVPGEHFRQDGWLAINTVRRYCDAPLEQLISILNSYPGSSRRMEKIAENIYSDYAHTPEKIIGCLATAIEMLKPMQRLVVIYEPLTNRRQHYIKEMYRDIFNSVSKLYWVPSYKAREDQNQRELLPSELIEYLKDPSIASPENLDGNLWGKIKKHQANGDFIVIISGGGGGSLDEWTREMLKP